MCVCVCLEHNQSRKCHWEPVKLGEAAWADKEVAGSGNPQLPGRGAEAAQNHFSAGKGARPLYQRSQWPHTEGNTMADTRSHADTR